MGIWTIFDKIRLKHFVNHMLYSGGISFMIITMKLFFSAEHNLTIPTNGGYLLGRATLTLST